MFTRQVFLLKFCKIPLKTPQTCNSVKRLQYRCFPVNFAKYVRTPFYRATMDNCFWIFSFILLLFLPPSELIETRFFKNFEYFTTSFEYDECHEFYNLKTILCKTNEGALKHLLKLTRKHVYRSLFFNQVTRQRLITLLKRDLQVQHNLLETYFIDYF